MIGNQPTIQTKGQKISEAVFNDYNSFKKMNQKKFFPTLEAKTIKVAPLSPHQLSNSKKPKINMIVTPWKKLKKKCRATFISGSKGQKGF